MTEAQIDREKERATRRLAQMSERANLPLRVIVEAMRAAGETEKKMGDVTITLSDT